MHYHSLLYLQLKDNTDLPMHLNVGFNVFNCRVHRVNHMSTTINVIVKVRPTSCMSSANATALKSYVEVR